MLLTYFRCDLIHSLTRSLTHSLAHFSLTPQTLFEQAPFIAVYNLFYTSQPVLALGVFDQDVNAYNSLKYPKLYYAGLRSSLFNKKEFFKSAIQGFLTSCVLFFAAHGTLVSDVRQGILRSWSRFPCSLPLGASIHDVHDFFYYSTPPGLAKDIA